MAAPVPVSLRATDNSMGVPDYFVAHKELVERAGHYARLYSHQSEGAVVTPIGS